MNKYVQEYRELKAEASFVQHCHVCRRLGSKSAMDAHHPQGRAGSNVTKFFWVCRTCHDYAHKNPKWATEHGFLLENRQHPENGPDA